jgi:3-methyladenine DNA glycosylase/8-oxoguanine DNA glycosylase
LRVPSDFDLRAAVCSYGYFMLAPNRWEPDSRRLLRPLRDARERIVHAQISQTRRGPLRIRCDRRLSRTEADRVRCQVARMLRIDEDFTAWRRIHPQARRAGFGRLFRSPDLFEDAVKTITACNVSWSNTITMNRLLCDRIGGGGFPTPRQLAATDPMRLRRSCRVGYRAQRIIGLARSVVRGEMDLPWLEDPRRTTDEIHDRLLEVDGIGPYCAANLCQHLGRYDRLAIDTETYRHVTGRRGGSRLPNRAAMDRRIRARYRKYRPYQFLAYWFELWCGYKQRAGGVTSLSEPRVNPSRPR